MFDDFKDLLSAFNAANVRYLIVGGYAVSLHAQPRATKDLDILISTDSENSRAVYMALTKFGAPVEGLSAMDFTEPDNFFRMGTPPVMVDIIPKISGVEFESAWSRRVTIAIDEALTVSFISRADLLAAKIAAGRAQDLADVVALRESAKHEHEEQHESSHDISPAIDEIQRIRAQGRKEWLTMRQSQQTGNSRDDRSHDHDESAPKGSPGLDTDDELEP
jgi:hypothetical protein